MNEIVKQAAKLHANYLIDLYMLVEPTLTTIAQPIQKLGTEAARILISKINGEKDTKDQIVFDPELIIREST